MPRTVSEDWRNSGDPARARPPMARPRRKSRDEATTPTSGLRGADSEPRLLRDRLDAEELERLLRRPVTEQRCQVAAEPARREDVRAGVHRDVLL